MFDQPTCEATRAARLNRRATRPNAIRVSVINDWVDPESGTLRAHVPGASKLRPDSPVPSGCVVEPSSNMAIPTVLNDSIWCPPVPSMIDASTVQPMIDPDASVAKKNDVAPFAVRLVIVCTPSDDVNAVGVTWVSGMFAPSGPANVSVTVTKSLVV